MAQFQEYEPIYCSTCGREVDAQARFCSNCGAAINQLEDVPKYRSSGYVEPAEVPNYLVWSILVTLLNVFCCCVPIGIVAIVFAAQVNGKLEAGDYGGAVRLSDNARTWCWISFALCIVGAIIWVVYIALILFGAISGF